MDNKEPKLTDAHSLQEIQTAGKKLSAARISWELDIEDVAENLNLSVHAVEALEKDDYEKLPGYTFVKGYIRSYATLLRLDPEDVLNGVDLQPEKLSEIPSAKSSLKIKSRSRPKKKKSGGKFLKAILFLVLLVVLSLVGLNQFSKLDKVELARMFKLPSADVSGKADKDDNEIVFPDTTNDAPASETSEPKKEALIRIE